MILPLVAAAASPLETWRGEAARIRQLAENDSPLAYEQALHLQTAIPPTATPADQTRALNLLARIEIHLALTDQAAKHAQLALESARKNGDRIGQAEAQLNICLTSVNQGDIEQLIGAASESISLLDGIDRPDLLGEALLRTTMMYRRTGRIEDSVTMCMQAMEIAQRTHNSLALTYAHQGLAISYDQSERDQEALDHYLKMRDEARAAGSKLLEAYAVAGTADMENKIGNRAHAVELSGEAIRLFREVGTPFNIYFGLFGLAHNLFQQGRAAEALPLLDEVVAGYGRHPNRIGLWYTLNARSEIHQALGNVAAARADAERAYSLAGEIGFALYLSDSSQRLAAIAAANGEHKRAYELSLEAAEMTSKAEREKSRVRMVELAQRYESESKQREINELTRRNQQQAIELEQRALRQRWLWTVLGSSVLALLGAAAFLVRLRWSQQLLAATNAKLRTSQNEFQKQTGILQSVVHSMSEGVCVANERGEMILVNPAGEEILGIGATQGDTGGWSDRYGFFLPDQITPFPPEQLPLARAMRGERCDNVEIYVRNAHLREGRWLAVNARPLRNGGNAPHGGAVVFSNITARKQADEQIRAVNATLERRVEERTQALAKSEERYRLLFETMLQGVVHQDANGRIIFMNPAAEHILGKTRAEFIGQTSAEVEHRTVREDGTSFPVSEHPARVALRTGHEVRNVVMGVLNSRDQTLRWINVTAMPLFRAGDQAAHEVYIIFDDITERRLADLRVKQLNRQLDCRARALEAANKELETFSYSVSHDLRAPLRSMDGFSRTLLEDYSDRLDEEGKDNLRRIRAACQRMGLLIDDLLNLARVSRENLHHATVDLSALARTVTDKLRAETAGHTVEFVIEPNLVASGDARLLQIVLENLLGNACKFSRLKPAARIEFGRTIRQGEPTYFVRDNGAGFDLSCAKKLFGAFQRFHTAAEFPGTGIGLATVQRIIHRHGGLVAAESQLEHGATFYFTLPDHLPENS